MIFIHLKDLTISLNYLRNELPPSKTKVLVFRDKIQQDHFTKQLSLQGELYCAEDFLTINDYHDINDAAYDLIPKSFHALRDTEFSHYWRYKDIDLPEALLSHYVSYCVGYCKTVRMMNVLLRHFKPRQLTIISDDPEFVSLASAVASHINVAVTSLPFPRDNHKFIQQKQRPSNTFLTVFRNLCCIGSWLAIRLFCVRKIKNKSKQRIAFLHDRSFLTDYIDRTKHELVVLPRIFGFKEWWTFTRRGDLYWNINVPYKKLCHKIGMFIKVKTAAPRIWDFINKSAVFKDSLSFDGISLAEVMHPLLRDFIFNKLATFTFYIDNLLDCVETIMPDIFVCYVGFLAEERIAIAVFTQQGKKTLLLNHSIGGNTENIKWYERMRIGYTTVCTPSSKEHMLTFKNCSAIYILKDFKFHDFKSKKTVDRADLCKTLGIATNKRLLTLATTRHSSYIFAAHNRHDLSAILIKTMARVLDDDPDYELVIKLHPSENPARYSDFLVDIPPAIRERIHIVAKIHLYSLLKESAVVLTPGSTVAYEAMLFERPVIILDFLQLPDGRPFCEHKACFNACNIDEIKQLLQRIVAPTFDQQAMVARQKIFLNEMCEFSAEEHKKNLSRLFDTIINEMVHHDQSIQKTTVL